MRLLFFLIVLLNIVVLAYGQGFFGTPPSEQGREPRMLMMQRNPQAVTLGAPLTPEQAREIQAPPAAHSGTRAAQPHARH
ncbi:hypothetical protein [Candidimonas nitroreducens]|uniref:Uncharacterized protein n=1 Tax=Candidimonas nitroreducens TaxID=683354 RepID=A0A225M4U2_9BURK|nr:hypothetical protein [Candidimonas nitroreducens]OWT53969.1 hypothetical protein CEY11_23560 [Candidimonas nitroreducens]